MKKYLLGLLLGASVVGSSFAASLSSPSYVQYSDSMSTKKATIKQVIETASQTHASKIYIYYHDEQSQELAIKISNKITGRVPSGCVVNLVDQKDGEPKYPSTVTPNGVALVIEN